MSRRNPTPQPRRTGARIVWPTIAALVLGALAVVEFRHRTVAFGTDADHDAPTWIWRNHDLEHVQAAGFYAVKEFVLAAAPAEAEVRILGDAEYVLILNGVRIGSNRYVSGATIDRYAVGRWLEAGRNRLVVELRSPSGSGGFWFELLSGGQQLVRSDGSWTTYQTNWKGLYGGRPMPDGERPKLLGRSPLGRWGSPAIGPLRPPFEAVLSAPEPLPAESFRLHGPNEDWQSARKRGRRPPNLGTLVEFDFGAERTGYLQLSFREGAQRREEANLSAVLVAFGDEPIGPPIWSAQTLFRPIPGSGLYQDSTLRKFRYVAVAGLTGLFSAEVLATSSESWPALAPPQASAAGILGIRPPPSSAPVEHEVWRELERATGGAVGKER